MELGERIQRSLRASECLIVDISRGSVTGRTSRGGRSSIEEPTGALFIRPCCATRSWVVPDTHSRPGTSFALKERRTSSVEALPCLQRLHDPTDGRSRQPGRCRRMGENGAAKPACAASECAWTRVRTTRPETAATWTRRVSAARSVRSAGRSGEPRPRRPASDGLRAGDRVMSMRLSPSSTQRSAAAPPAAGPDPDETASLPCGSGP